MAQINIPHVDPETAQEIKKVSTRATVCLVLSIVSAFYGGVILGAVALGFGLSARSKLEKTAAAVGDEAFVVGMRKTVKRCLIVCIILLVLNAIALAIMWPAIMYVMETGDYASLFTVNPISSTNGSIWD